MTDPSNYDIEVSGEMARVRGTGQLKESWDWFQRLWAVGVIAHIVGNPRVGEVIGEVTILGVVSLVLGLVALAAVLRPDDRRLLLGLAVLVPVSAWLEAPVLSNHWLLATFVSFALLAALVTQRTWAWFSTTGRALHLAFYGFAAFAKLNTDFFEPTVSCAVVFANQTLSSAGLPTLGVDRPLAVALPVVIVGIELAIPVLLLRARTRFAGVVLGVAFHSLVSFDLGQHFYDFTGILLPLFLLWLPSTRLDGLGEYLRERTQFIVGLVLILFVVASIMPQTQVTALLLGEGFFLVWIPFAIALTVYVVSLRIVSHDTSYRPPDLLAWVFAAAVILNGLMPYAEIKTANAWNMYSNLAVVDGTSNHLIVRTALPGGSGHEGLVEVLSSDDPGLIRYVDSGWLLPDRTFRQYLAGSPEIGIEFHQDGTTYAGMGSDFGEGSSSLIEKLFVLRAVDSTAPARCQTVWLPAR